MSKEIYTQKFSVPFEYPVHFCEDIFDASNPILNDVMKLKGEPRIHKAMVYIDSGVAEKNPALIDNIKSYFESHSSSMSLVCDPEIIAGTEKAKSGWDDVKDIMSAIGDQHMCRQSYVIAIGGGSVLDMVGFAASLVHRGLRLIRVPTTVLAQNDAGVGVKNAMNEHNAKNFLGTFAPPFAVLNDSKFLTTLSDEHWIGGIAEAFKVAIIKDADFFSFLKTNAEKLTSRDMPTMNELVHRCAVIHLEHIRTEGDPFEFGSSRPLDFGHWSAHKIEVMERYNIGHGQAVSVGIAIDAYYAMRKELITMTELDQILEALTSCHLPIWSDVLERKSDDGQPEVISGLKQFREHLGGELTIAMPKSIGHICEVNEIDPDIVMDAIEFLKIYETK